MRKSTIENLKTCQPREQNMQLSFDKRCSFPAQNNAFSLGQTRLMSGKLSRLKSKHTRKNRHASGLNENGSI